MIDPHELIRKRQSLKLLSRVFVSIGLTALIAVGFLLRTDAPLTASSEQHWQVWWVGVAAAILLAFLILRRHRAEFSETGKKLDQTAPLHNRLEAAAELMQSTTPLAQAHRAETSQHLEKHPLPASTGSFAMIIVGLVCFLAYLVLGGTWTAQEWMKPEPPVHASLRWQLPAAEIKAGAIEEVPLEAKADSTAPWKKMELQVNINGVDRPPVVIDAPAEGKQNISSSLFLDELEVQPYDLVTYFLRGTPKGSAREFRTAIQTIQVRPAEETTGVLEGQGLTKEQRAAAASLTQFKSAQLLLMKENFLLASDPIDHQEKVWQKENQRVAEQQTLLARKTEEALKTFEEAGVPAAIYDLVQKTIPLMETSGQNIAKEMNDAARPPQSQALAHLVEIEKYFRKVLLLSDNPPKSQNKKEAEDPFKDEQKLELPKRSATSAGALEELLQAQEKLVEELPERPATASAEAQEKNNAQMEKLSQSDALSATVRESIAQAAQAGATTQQSLQENDRVGAREPAAQTLRHLRAAVDQMNQSGQQQAADALRKAQDEMNQAADALEKGKGAGAKEAAEQVAQAREQLKDEAQRQQQSGSEWMAQKLDTLAQEVGKQGIPSQLQKMAQAPNPAEAGNVEEVRRQIEALAVAMAGAAQNSSGNLEALAQQLEQTANVLQRATEKTPEARVRQQLEELQRLNQTARATSANPQARASTGTISEKLRQAKAGPFQHNVTVIHELAAHAKELVQTLRTPIESNERKTALQHFEPESVPTSYRESVARYFEQLSRAFDRPTPAQP